VDEIVLGVVWYAVFVFSTTLHEAAHAWVALRGGDATAYHGGQVSLDPRPHIRREPWGMVLVPIVTFSLGGWMMGWASAPYDPRWAWAHPRRAAAMALAGPLANLALAVIAAVTLRAGLAAGFFAPPIDLGFAHLAAGEGAAMNAFAIFTSLLFSLNLLLFVFNLFPVPPLDGSAAIGLLVSDEAGRRIQQLMAQPFLMMFGVLAAWYLIGRVFAPIFLAAVRLLYG
jgi:Zn-dependent protease